MSADCERCNTLLDEIQRLRDLLERRAPTPPTKPGGRLIRNARHGG